MSLNAFLAAVVPLANLVALGLAFVAVVALTYLYSSFGVVFALASFIIGVLTSPDVPVAQGALTQVGGVLIYPEDVAFSVLAIAALLRWLHIAGRSRLPLPFVALLIYVILLLTAFVRGVAPFGLQAAGVGFRGFFFFAAGAAYSASFEATRERLEWTMRAWIAASVVVCAIAFVRFAIALTHLDFGRLRVVGSGPTLLVAQALLVCLFLWMDSSTPNLYRNLALLFFPFVILMQHRTVWVMLFVALMLVALREARLRSRMLVILVTAAMLSAAGALFIYGDRSSSVLEASATNTDNFAWRVEGWRVLLGQQAEQPLDLVAGRPFGAGYQRYLPSLGYSVDVTPHNYYVEVLLRTGVIGLFVLLVLYGSLVRSALAPQHDAARKLFARLGVVLLVSQLVYFIPYGPGFEQGILLGMVLSLSLPAAVDTIERARGRVATVNDE